MKFNTIKSIAVIGAGEMGHGIAEICAIAGYTVSLKDVNHAVLDKAMNRIRQSLEGLTRRGRVTADQIRPIMERIHPCLKYADLGTQLPFCIEAVPELMPLKVKVFTELEAVLPQDAIIASNTSTISITELAATTPRSDRFIGMHFFTPVVIMDPVEIIKGDRTSENTVTRAKEVAELIGKIPILIRKDVPGFMINRVSAPSGILACKAVDLGFATPRQIDAMARKMGLPMGPFEVMDLQGLDVIKHGSDYLTTKYGKEYALPAWFAQIVQSGYYGQKSGRGIHDYTAGRPEFDLNDLPDPAKISMRDFIAVQINEASKLIEAGIMDDPADIDVAIMTGTGNKSGIFGLLAADRQGVIDRLQQLTDLYHVEMFRPINFLQTMPIPNARKKLKAWKKQTHGIN